MKIINIGLVRREPVDLKSPISCRPTDMIDEELYKIATDELNSDSRKPAVWARACALASDDHDEARFLYTNLRVEEMLNKDGKQRTFSADRSRRDSNLSSADKLDTLELVDSDGTEPASVRTGISNDDSPLPNDGFIDFDSTVDASHTSVAGTREMTGDLVEFDDETLAELDALSDSNKTGSKPLSGITGKPIDKPLTIDQPSTNDIVSEVFGSSAAANRAKIVSPEDQRTNELAHKLERQAESMADTEDAVDTTIEEVLIEPEVETLTSLETEQKYEETIESGQQVLEYKAEGESPQDAIRPDYADDILDADDTMDVDSELDSGIGRSYMVFSRRGDIKAIKRGVSWPALFFTFPWLLSKALLGTAIVYGCLWLVSLAGLLTTANTWLAAGADASLNIKLWTAGFALLAFIGLLYLPFRYGNRWAAEKLQNRGFGYEAAVSASSKRDAIDRLFEPND